MSGVKLYTVLQSVTFVLKEVATYPLLILFNEQEIKYIASWHVIMATFIQLTTPAQHHNVLWPHWEQGKHILKKTIYMPELVYEYS